MVENSPEIELQNLQPVQINLHKINLHSSPHEDSDQLNIVKSDCYESSSIQNNRTGNSGEIIVNNTMNESKSDVIDSQKKVSTNTIEINGETNQNEYETDDVQIDKECHLVSFPILDGDNQSRMETKKDSAIGAHKNDTNVVNNDEIEVNEDKNRIKVMSNDKRMKLNLSRQCKKKNVKPESPLVSPTIKPKVRKKLIGIVITNSGNCVFGTEKFVDYSAL